MDLESAIVQLNRFLIKRIQDLSISITSGGVDNMESYKYIIGQINALEATRQELSNLLDNKEQKSEGTIIDIKPNLPKHKPALEEKYKRQDANLPKPTGWRLLVLPYRMKDKT